MTKSAFGRKAAIKAASFGAKAVVRRHPLGRAALLAMKAGRWAHGAKRRGDTLRGTMPQAGRTPPGA